MKKFRLIIIGIIAALNMIAQNGETVSDYFIPIGREAVLSCPDDSKTYYRYMYNDSENLLLIENYIDGRRVNVTRHRLNISGKKVEIVNTNSTLESYLSSEIRPLLLLPERVHPATWTYTGPFNATLKCSTKRVDLLLQINGRTQERKAIEITEGRSWVDEQTSDLCSWSYKYYWMKNYGLLLILGQNGLHYISRTEAVPIYYVFVYDKTVLDSPYYEVKQNE